MYANSGFLRRNCVDGCFKIKLEKMLDEDKILFRPYPFLDSEGRIRADVEIVAL